jgi:predicted GIY-YIG superfamily endonuclease
MFLDLCASDASDASVASVASVASDASVASVVSDVSDVSVASVASVDATREDVYLSVVDLLKMRIVDLKVHLKAHKLCVSGSKKELADRLVGVITESSVDRTAELWSFYIICNGRYTYAGVSPDPLRRLKAHNGEICNGARYTLSKGAGWEHVCIVNGFTKRSSLQFEWRHKKFDKLFGGNMSGIRNRLDKMIFTLKKDRYTSKSELSSLCPLVIDYYHDVYYDFLSVLPEHVSIKYRHVNMSKFNKVMI